MVLISRTDLSLPPCRLSDPSSALSITSSLETAGTKVASSSLWFKGSRMASMSSVLTCSEPVHANSEAVTKMATNPPVMIQRLIM